MSSCRGEQDIVDEWRENGGMDEWMEDIRQSRLELCVLRPPHRLLEPDTQQ